MHLATIDQFTPNGETYLSLLDENGLLDTAIAIAAKYEKDFKKVKIELEAIVKTLFEVQNAPKT